MRIVWLVAAAQRRFVAIDGYDRALALAAQAFVAVLPLLIVVAAWEPTGVRERLASLIGGLGLDDETSAAVDELITRPPDAAEPVTLFGLVLLVISVLGFARTMQRLFEAAWGLPRSGLRGYVPGFLGAAAFVGEVVVLTAVVGWIEPMPARDVIVGLGRAIVGALVWWPVQRVLVGGRVPWRDLLPGAVVTGLGQAIVIAFSAVYFRPLLEAQAERFGAIGVAFTIVTALIFFSVLIVVGAVLGPVVAGRDRGPRSEPLDRA